MLTLSKKVYEEIVAQCQRTYPKEACGILAGSEGLVEQIYPMRNIDDSPIGYSMDPKEQLEVEKNMRAHNQRMIGIYHSHTSSAAYPSSVDVSLAISPDVSYVLVSLHDRANPEIKSYRIDGKRIINEPLNVL